MLFEVVRADTEVVTTVRKLLLAVLLVSLAGSAFGAGTFASFNATTTNAAGTFATGSIVLSNTVNSQTACLSTSTGTAAGNTDSNSHGCDTLFNVTNAKPGDTSYVDLDLSNVGTIAATGFTLNIGACTPGNSGSTSYHGSTPAAICAATTGLKVQIQEYQTHGHAGTAQAKCIFPAAAAACASNYDYLGSAITTGTFTNPLTVTGMPTATPKYVTIAILFPDNGTSTVNGLTDNAYQGLTASFTLTWTITQ